MFPKPSSLGIGSLAGVDYATDGLGRLARGLKTPLQGIAFWSAIGLPFVQLSLLVQGLHNAEAVLMFFGLLALNVVALYIGHGYKQ